MKDPLLGQPIAACVLAVFVTATCAGQSGLPFPAPPTKRPSGKELIELYDQYQTLHKAAMAHYGNMLTVNATELQKEASSVVSYCSFCDQEKLNSEFYASTGNPDYLSQLVLCEFDRYLTSDDPTRFLQGAAQVLKITTKLGPYQSQIIEHVALLFEANGYHEEALMVWSFLENLSPPLLGISEEEGKAITQVHRLVNLYFVRCGIIAADHSPLTGGTPAYKPKALNRSSLIALLDRMTSIQLPNRYPKGRGSGVERLQMVAGGMHKPYSFSDPGTGQQRFDTDIDMRRFLVYYCGRYGVYETEHAKPLERHARMMGIVMGLRKLNWIRRFMDGRMDMEPGLTYEEAEVISTAKLSDAWWKSYASEDWSKQLERYRLNDVAIYANKGPRALLMEAAWKDSKDAQGLKQLAERLEASKDFATAAHFYQLAIASLKAGGVRDSIPVLKAHMLACSFFSKAPRPAPTLSGKAKPDCRADAYPGLMIAPIGEHLLVVDVVPNSGAEVAGIWPGDALVEVAGRKLIVSDTLENVLHAPSGSALNMLVQRIGNDKSLAFSVPIIAYGGPCGTKKPIPENLWGANSNETEVVAQQETKATMELTTLDTTFKQVRTWPAIAKNAALLQRVNRCLQIINHMAKEPFDGMTFGDVDKSLGLVAALAQIVSESKVSGAQMGGLESAAPTLSELAENPVAKEAAENVAPVNPADNSAGEVALDEGVSIVGSPTVWRCDLNGFYRCINQTGHSWGTRHDMENGPKTCTLGQRMEYPHGGFSESSLEISISGQDVKLTLKNSGTGGYGSSEVSGRLEGDVIELTKAYSTEFIGTGIASGVRSITRWNYEVNRIEIQDDCSLRWYFRSTSESNNDGYINHSNGTMDLRRK